MEFINVKVEKTEHGFRAYCLDFPIATEAISILELKELIYKKVGDFCVIHQISIDKLKLKFDLDLKQYFQFYKLLHPKFVASELGLSPTVFSGFLQGKEQPSSDEMKQIVIGMAKIGRDLAELETLL
jgi:hypothetical protein